MKILRVATTTQPEWAISQSVGTRKTMSLQIVDIMFLDITLDVIFIKAFFNRCTFMGETKIDVTAEYNDLHDVSMSLRIVDSVWDCEVDCDNTSYSCRPSCLIHAAMTTFEENPISVKNSVFKNTKLIIMAYPAKGKIIDITVQNCSFFSSNRKTSGGMELITSNTLGYSIPRNSVIQFKNCSFFNLSNLFHKRDRELYREVWDVAALKIEMQVLLPSVKKPFDIEITNCRFENNEVRALIVYGQTVQNFELSDSIFVNNIVLQGTGAGLYLDLSNDERGGFGKVKNCYFERNIAGYHPEFQSFKDAIQDQELNKLTNAALQKTAKGGAIAIFSRQSVILEKNQFVNNAATSLGGTIFATKAADAAIFIVNCNFSLEVDSHSQGAVIYSVRELHFVSANVLLANSFHTAAVIAHSEAPVTFSDFSIHCPLGQKLRIIAVGYTDALEGLYDISFGCYVCDRGLYSMDRGSFAISKSNSSVNYVTWENVSCVPCPFGGTCDGNLRALPSYWGYISKKKLIFLRCLEDQCCSESPCSGYDSCAENREGIMCTQCKRDFSHEFFTRKCVTTNSCTPTAFWLLVLSISFLYAILLLGWDEFCGRFVRGKENGTTFEFPHLILFCQDVHLLQKRENLNIVQKMVKVLSFERSVWTDVCIEGLNPTTAELYTILLGPAVVLQFVILNHMIQFGKRSFQFLQNSPEQNKNVLAISGRLGNCVKHKILMVAICAFQPVSLTTMTLLKCVHFSGNELLVVDTTVACFQPWQYLIMFFHILWTIPFVFYAAKAATFPRKSAVHTVFPLLFIRGWATKYLTKTNRISNHEKSWGLDGKETPENNLFTHGPVHWAAATLVRRFLLCLAYVFVPYSPTRASLLTVFHLSGISLLLFQQPYKESLRNCFLLFLQSVLFVFGVSHIIQSAFEVADFTHLNWSKSAIYAHFRNFVVFQSWVPAITIILHVICQIFWTINQNVKNPGKRFCQI